jgi:hypothetical protein
MHAYQVDFIEERNANDVVIDHLLRNAQILRQGRRAFHFGVVRESNPRERVHDTVPVLVGEAQRHQVRGWNREQQVDSNFCIVRKEDNNKKLEYKW